MAPEGVTTVEPLKDVVGEREEEAHWVLDTDPQADEEMDTVPDRVFEDPGLTVLDREGVRLPVPLLHPEGESVNILADIEWEEVGDWEIVGEAVPQRVGVSVEVEE